MANEVTVLTQEQLDCYFTILSATGQVFRDDTDVFEAPTEANRAEYAQALAASGITTLWQGSMPAGVPPGDYTILVWQQAGETPDDTDEPWQTAGGTWDGSKWLSLTRIAALGGDNVVRANAAYDASNRLISATYFALDTQANAAAAQELAEAGSLNEASEPAGLIERWQTLFSYDPDGLLTNTARTRDDL